MKLKPPFTVIDNQFRDIDYFRDFTNNLANEKQCELREQECNLYATKSTYKTYEV